MAKPKGAPKSGGRVKGVPNKTTAALKEAILHAFDRVGGVSYLEKVAKADPRTFCTLLGKVLPLTVAGDAAAPLELIVTWRQAPDDKSE